MASTVKAEVRIWGSFFLQYLWKFCLGMEVAEYMMNHDEIRVPVPELVIRAFGGIGLSALAMFGGKVFTVFNDISAPFGYDALALFLYYLRFIDKEILFISKFSYEWYLVHILVFSMVFLISVYSLMGRCVLGFASLILSVLVALEYSMLFMVGKVKQ